MVQVYRCYPPPGSALAHDIFSTTGVRCHSSAPGALDATEQPLRTIRNRKGSKGTEGFVVRLRREYGSIHTPGLLQRQADSSAAITNTLSVSSGSLTDAVTSLSTISLEASTTEPPTPTTVNGASSSSSEVSTPTSSNVPSTLTSDQTSTIPTVGPGSSTEISTPLSTDTTMTETSTSSTIVPSVTSTTPSLTSIIISPSLPLSISLSVSLSFPPVQIPGPSSTSISTSMATSTNSSPPSRDTSITSTTSLQPISSTEQPTSISATVSTSSSANPSSSTEQTTSISIVLTTSLPPTSTTTSSLTTSERTTPEPSSVIVIPPLSSSSIFTSSTPTLSSSRAQQTSLSSSLTIFDPTTRAQTSRSSPALTPTTSWMKLTTTTQTRTSTMTDGRTTTFVTIIATGVLSTDVPKGPGFARNTGAIIGVALSVTFIIILIVFAIFFWCKRYKARNSAYGSTDHFLVSAHSASWRPPLDGDDDSYMGEYTGQALGGHARGRDEDHNIGGVPVQERSFANTPFAESAPSGPVPDMVAPPDLLGLSNQLQHTIEPGPFPLGNDPFASYTGPLPPTSYNRSVGGTRSATSLTLHGGSSSGEHGTSSLGGGGVLRASTKRSSTSGPHPVSTQMGRSQSPTPPTRDLELQVTERSDRASVKNFFNRLRTSRRMSSQSVSTMRNNSPAHNSQESVMATMYSPSLLNPPILVSTPRPSLHIPRNLSANSYSLSHSQMVYNPQPTVNTLLWPPATLPPPPSPVPTDDSSMVEGLLHPRLRLSQDFGQQASTASLRDHEDYSRPIMISGFVNHRFRSTTTFGTAGSDDGR